MSAPETGLARELMDGLQPRQVLVDEDVQLHAWIGGQGPALLLVHGHPQTGVIWHRLVATLARDFTLVVPDLRGYGDSSKPRGGADHANYSKRRMARDLLRLMQQLGHARFSVLAHDRGARVAHRLAMDHPHAVQRLVLLDIAPTLAMYEQTSEDFARAYWHWFFLIQPGPLPERLIEADAAAYVREVMGGRSAGLAPFDARALGEYMRCLAMPLLVLWGEQGVIERCFHPLEEWRKLADDVRGGPLPCGHYIAEEAPQALLDAALPFLRGEGA